MLRLLLLGQFSSSVCILSSCITGKALINSSYKRVQGEGFSLCACFKVS